MIELISTLRQRLQKTANRKMRTPKDFDFLSESIYKATHEMVNTSTLKRLYGYIGEVRCPRESTLNILCRYIGYKSWSAFVEQTMTSPENESSVVLNGYLYSDEMRRGEQLRILWQPDRELVIRYEGNERFTVTKAVNTKLQEGNTLRCAVFIQQEPLFLTEVTGLTSQPTNFVCGSKNGITFM